MRKNFEVHKPSDIEIKKEKDWTLENVASIGNLPKNPTNADLVKYGIQNGLLNQGEGIKQLVIKAEQFDQESANILKAVVDANMRAKKDKNKAFTGTIKPEGFSNSPRRTERNPRKFEKYAQEEINDMMGAWVMTKFSKNNLTTIDLSPTYKEILYTLEFKDKLIAKKLLSVLGDSGIRRTLVRDTTNDLASLENRRNTVYYIEHILTSCSPLQQLKELLKENTPEEEIEKISDGSRKKISNVLIPVEEGSFGESLLGLDIKGLRKKYENALSEDTNAFNVTGASDTVIYEIIDETGWQLSIDKFNGQKFLVGPKHKLYKNN